MKNMAFCYFNYEKHGEEWVSKTLGIRPDDVYVYNAKARHLILGEPLASERQRGLSRIKQFFPPSKAEKEIECHIKQALSKYEFDMYNLYFVKQLEMDKIKQIIAEKHGERSEKTLQNLPRHITAKIKKNCYARETANQNEN